MPHGRRHTDENRRKQLTGKLFFRVWSFEMAVDPTRTYLGRYLPRYPPRYLGRCVPRYVPKCLDAHPGLQKTRSGGRNRRKTDQNRDLRALCTFGDHLRSFGSILGDNVFFTFFGIFGGGRGFSKFWEIFRNRPGCPCGREGS